MLDRVGSSDRGALPSQEINVNRVAGTTAPGSYRLFDLTVR